MRCSPQHLILREERSCILRLSLQKLRFLDDPETYLRRSVLINNLLRKIHSDGVRREAEEEEEVERHGDLSSRRLFYSGGKRLKVLVAECCSPSFSLQDLQQCRLLPYPSPPGSCACGLAGCPTRPPDCGPPILLYQLDDC